MPPEAGGIADRPGPTVPRNQCSVRDSRLALLYDADIDSPYSYWFVCRPVELETRPVRLFHDWLVEARL